MQWLTASKQLPSISKACSCNLSFGLSWFKLSIVELHPVCSCPHVRSQSAVRARVEDIEQETRRNQFRPKFTFNPKNFSLEYAGRVKLLKSHRCCCIQVFLNFVLFYLHFDHSCTHISSTFKHCCSLCEGLRTEQAQWLIASK